MLRLGDVVHPTYLRATVQRALFLWLLCRLVLTTFGALSTGIPLVLPPLAEAFARPHLHQLARRGLFLLPERGLLRAQFQREYLGGLQTRRAPGPAA